MARIVITEFMDERAVARLARAFDVRYDPKLVDNPAWLKLELGIADAMIVRNRTQVSSELVASLKRCQVIGRLGVGVDNIDMAACKRRRIKVITATGANAQSVAEYVLTTAMVLLRGAYMASANLAAGNWPREQASKGRELAGRTIGLIGFGATGQATARTARALGLDVIAFDLMLDASHPAYAECRATRVGLKELIASADIVSLHVPLADSTRGMVGAAAIATMKPGAILINAAHGGIVDEQAVAAALRARKLGGAALDSFEHEPLPESPHFINCPNLILTPHIAGVTADSNDRVSACIADRVMEALSEVQAA